MAIAWLGTVILLVGSANSVAPSAELTLRYDQPAKAWSSEALPLGNGRLGCMVFGGVQRERIQFNEDSLWTGDDNPSGEYKSMGAYQNFGDLFVELRDGGPESGYQRVLSLNDATHRVKFTRDGVTHTRTAFASHPDNVIVMRWTADRAGAVSGKIILQGAHGETTKAADGELSFAGKFANGLAYEARLGVLSKGGAVEARSISAGANFSTYFGRSSGNPRAGLVIPPIDADRGSRAVSSIALLALMHMPCQKTP